MTDHAALITKLEATTESSRELDHAIIETAGVPNRYYTSSLDAALTLVPEGWGWAVGSLDEGPSTAVVTNREPQIIPGTLDANPNKVDFRTKAPTPALALCISALNAGEAGKRAYSALMAKEPDDE